VIKEILSKEDLSSAQHEFSMIRLQDEFDEYLKLL